jgi:hypothetical protein
MVHRPVDFRLLSNLLQQEKDIQHNSSRSSTSDTSLASSTAYAAALILYYHVDSEVLKTKDMRLAGGYQRGSNFPKHEHAPGVDEWREMMLSLKDAAEIGNNM